MSANIFAAEFRRCVSMRRAAEFGECGTKVVTARLLLQSVAVLVIAGGVSMVSGAARSADMATKAPPQGCVQAVDGFNGKISGYGGSFANDALYAGTGTVALPLGCAFGAQISSTGASFDGRFLGATEGHLFWRNPSQGLLGVYGSYVYWNQAGGVRSSHIGPEAELYSGRWTLQGVAGVEFGNNTSSVVGSVIQTYDVKTRFFDQVDLAYYLQDNLRVYAGHRYLGGEHALALGGEWGIPMSHGVMAALFAEGRVGEDNFHGVWGGVRVYFGQKDKTLIRRHREDDPIDWGAGEFGGVTNGASTSPVPTSTPQSCPNGDILVNGVCEPPV